VAYPLRYTYRNRDFECFVRISCHGDAILDEGDRNHLYKDTSWEQVAPLLQRAWVLQERLLAPRVIHFSSAELWWECKAESLCECGVECPNLKNGKTSKQWDEASYRWRAIVAEYTKLSLTDQFDKLPALAGLVKDMHSLFPYRYVAGLWYETLAKDLLWLQKGGPSDRPTTYRAPSWSWASTDKPVYYANRVAKIIYSPEILKCESEPDGPDSYGRCKSGFLVVRTRSLSTT